MGVIDADRNDDHQLNDVAVAAAAAAAAAAASLYSVGAYINTRVTAL